MRVHCYIDVHCLVSSSPLHFVSYHTVVNPSLQFGFLDNAGVHYNFLVFSIIKRSYEPWEIYTGIAHKYDPLLNHLQNCRAIRVIYYAITVILHSDILDHRRLRTKLFLGTRYLYFLPIYNIILLLCPSQI